MADGASSFLQGIGWVGATFWAALFTLLGVIIRQIGPWRKQSMDAEQKLRDDLIKRVEKLEQTLESERARHDAERALDRHRLNNVSQCFDAMLLMIEASPEKAQEIVVKIKEMRARQIEAETLEKAAIYVARIDDVNHGGNA